MTSTDTELSPEDRRVILRMLWAFYLGALALAVGFFVAYVVTGNGLHLAEAVAACLAAWFVTNPLDELRRDGAS
jgi:hypothetical protein